MAAKVRIEGAETLYEGDFQYVEGGVWEDGKVTFHIETDKYQIHLEFDSEEEFNEHFIKSLKEQLKESKQRLKEEQKKE